MDQYTTLQKTVKMAREGNWEAYENFYILTNPEVYYLAHSIVRDEEQAEALMMDIYVAVYQSIRNMPLEEEEIYEVISRQAGRLAMERLDIDEETLEQFHIEKGIKEKISEERVTNLWLAIEERILSVKEQKEEVPKTSEYVVSGLKIALTVMVVVTAVVVVVAGWKEVKEKAVDRERAAFESSSLALELEKGSQIYIEEELPSPGWRQQGDGSLNYIKKDHIEARGDVPIGKQMFTFSESGTLEAIRDNEALNKQEAVCQDGDVRYEVIEGDIYRKRKEDEERACIIRNGHAWDVNIQAGILYFICEFEVPNSELVKTSIYRSDPDGANPMVVWEKMERAYEAGAFNTVQVTDQWLYYVSGGDLFRRALDKDETEILARGVKNYLALDQDVYYMADGELRHTSIGLPFVDGKINYHVVVNEDSFSLEDELGNLVESDETGQVQIGDRIYRIENQKIKYVKPADRTYGDITYYINDAAIDKKLYWRTSQGMKGLLRQSGKWVDSFCIADKWLYYSAYMGTDDAANPLSQIFRLNLENGTEEAVSGLFKGNLTNLYYFESTKEIYGEYAPESRTSMYGQVAVLTADGGFFAVADGGVRPESELEGNDTMEIVMADEGKVYCLWHDCRWDQESGQLEIVTTKPVVLDASARSAILQLQR